jgi:hypothetical protein
MSADTGSDDILSDIGLPYISDLKFYTSIVSQIHLKCKKNIDLLSPADFFSTGMIFKTYICYNNHA